MPSGIQHPTPYPAVNAVLSALLEPVRAVLGEQFVGMYLYGSLASGDFNPETSDIDFLVVTAELLSDKAIAELERVHQGIAASGMEFAIGLEGMYLPRRLLRRFSPEDNPPLPSVNEGSIYLAPQGWDWVLQRWVLREQGVVVAGPPIRDEIDPVSEAQIREAVRELLAEWWEPIYRNPARLRAGEYQAYAILSMCRALVALQTGAIVSKGEAARWARGAFQEPWVPAIAKALAWRKGQPFEAFQEARDLIRFTLQASRAGNL